MAIKFNNKSGFTLIEMIVAISVMGIVLVMGSNMFFSILKGTSKAEIEKEVKQNGDYAMNVMTRMIRNAKNIEVCDPADTSQITILNPDNLQTVFSFSPTSISSNSALLTSSSVVLETGTGSFECDLSNSPSAVTIAFTLTQASLSSKPEDRARIPFQTSISLRNY